MNNESRITDIVDFNPPRKLKKGQIAPFIDMAALPTNERDIVEITEKAFTGGAKFRNGDTLFARITPCLENGKTGKVSNLSDEVIGHGSTEFIVMTAKDSEIDEDYVYYLARLPEFRKFAQMRMTGTSGRQRVSWQDLAEFTFAFPEPEKRKAAGVFLKTIDDKIQLNTQTNQTLEQIAQAIYKSWFVDYEPTRAKAAVLAAGGSKAEAESAAMRAISGKTAAALATLAQNHPARYQQLADLAAAFPAALVPTDDFGEIPEGWEVKRIEDVIQKIPVGKKYSQKTVTEKGKVPVLDQGKSGLIGYHNDKAGVQASLENPVIVFANHTCYMRLITYDFSAIQNVFAFRGKNCNVLWLYLATLGKQQFVDYKGHFPDFLIKDIVVPPDELTEIFGRQVKHLFYKVAINDKENKTLSETRDAILPKLLSGDFSDAKTS